MSEVSEDSSFSGSSVSSGSDASDTVDFDLFSSQHDSDASDENLDDIVAAKTIGLDFDDPIAEQHTILPPQDEVPSESSQSDKPKEGTTEVSSKEEPKPSRMLPMFIMLLGAIVGVLFMALNKQPEQVPEATKPTVEEQKSVVVEQKKEAPSKEAPVQEPEKVVKAVEIVPPSQKESPPPPTKTVSKVASKTKTKTKTKTKKNEKPVTETKVEEKATGFGFVTINARPMRGLTITINGKTSNRPLRKFKVPVGTHKYTIQHKDKTKTGKIVVKRDELKRICWNFKEDSEC